jgi:hypothetical protein
MGWRKKARALRTRGGECCTLNVFFLSRI